MSASPRTTAWIRAIRRARCRARRSTHRRHPRPTGRAADGSAPTRWRTWPPSRSWRRCSVAAPGGSRWATRSRTARSRTSPATSRMPLSDMERMLVLSAMGGTTGWHYSITRNAHYAPHAANYAGRGRRAHLPVRGRLPHRRAVLHRRLRRVLLPDPGRRRAGRTRRSRRSRRSSWSSATRGGCSGCRTGGSTCRPRSPTSRATTPGA